MKRTGPILFLLLISFTLMSLVVRHDVPDERFIALANDYPQVAHLSDGEATLIRENWVVTAAHAAMPLQEELEYGDTPQVTIDDKKYEVVQVMLHPEFELGNTHILNDIALIQIKGNIIYIPFPLLYDQLDEKGKRITIVGRGDFGTGLTGPQKMDKITRAATNKIDKAEGQWVAFKFDGPDSANTTELEGVSGPGDSGGPAFIDIDGVRYLLGISSHQMGDGKEGVYGVTEYYARISFYKDWIEEMIR